MSQDQIQLPEPDGRAWKYRLSNARGIYWEDPAIYGLDVAHPDYELENIYKATTVRRLIAEAVAAEQIRATEEANRRANASWSLMVKKMVEAEREACAQICDSMPYRAASAGKAAQVIRSRGLAAKSAGELQAVDRSTETAARPRIHPLDGSPRAGGLACDRVPIGVPPRGLEREGHLPASDHQSVRGDVVRGPGVLGGLAGERPDDGGVAE